MHACSGLRALVTYHPIRLDIIAMQQPAHPNAVFVGELNRSKCLFSIGHQQSACEFLRGCQQCNCFENLERNPEPNHLALPMMLSALKHKWGMLALFVAGY